MHDLIPPHGGLSEPLDLQVLAAEQSDFRSRAASWKKLPVSDADLSTLYRLGDEFFATGDACPHLGASLSEGCVVDGYIECPLHSALFDIRTGASDGSMTSRPVSTLPVPSTASTRNCTL